MDKENKVLVDGNSKLIDVLQTSGTLLNWKYLYLPYWFEKTEDSNLLAYQLGEKLPINLADVIMVYKNDYDGFEWTEALIYEYGYSELSMSEFKEKYSKNNNG